MDNKVLVVGDLHATPDELADCSALIQFITSVCREEEITEIWWTGDQHHTHAVLRLEVLNWFKAAFKALKSQGVNSVCLVGNHDQASPGQSVHAMMAYRHDPGVKVIDTPTIHRGVLFVPYMHEQVDFIKAVNSFNHHQVTHTLFCHQTFDGSTYENGFLASDGFDPSLVPQELIISGHIHTGQEFGKVWYVGSPRWRTLSDANVERAIWVLTFKDGRLVDRKPYSTGAVCRQIKHVDDTPDSSVQLPLDLAHQWRIDIKGPPDWCHARNLELKAAGARTRTFPTQASTIGRVRESLGIAQAFRSYLDSFQTKYSTPKHLLEQMSKERLSV